MSRRVSLSTKILLLALLNLLIVAGLFLAFAQLHFRFDLGSFLLVSARERVVSTSRLAALELTDTPRSHWTALLKSYASRYPAKFSLFDENASQIAGEAMSLPAAFAQELRHHPIAHFPAGPPPPPRGFDHGPPPLPPGERHRMDLPFYFLQTSRPTEYWIGVPIPIWTSNTEDALHGVLVWRFQSLWLEPFFIDIRPWIVMVGAALLIPAACWIPFVRRMTGSITRMTAATGQIADGHFDITLPAERRDELGALSDSINRMAARLAGYVQGQKRFLGDIAHELSSPIARMQLALGILEQRVTGTASGYIVDVREELEEMSSLVNELLQFSRTGAASQQINPQPIELAPLIGRVVNREGTPEAAVQTHVPAGLFVMADGDCLFRALANVLRNAVRYAGSAGPITVCAAAEHDRVQIEIADQGPGIPPAELENVFRPFYRPEFARTRETGGAGLGLAIVRDCIESCGGHVECRNLSPHGLKVIIRIPAVPAPVGRLVVS